MKRNEKPSTSKQARKFICNLFGNMLLGLCSITFFFFTRFHSASEEKDDVQEKEPYSPTKYISEMLHFETERIIKIAEAETRLEFRKTFKNARKRKHGKKICSMNVEHFLKCFYLN